MTPHAPLLHLHADAQVVAQRLPAHDRAPGDGPTSVAWLRAMARTLAQTPMAADKAGRWMGYIHGVGTAKGWWRSQWCAPSSHQGFDPAPPGDPDVAAHRAVLRDLAARLPLDPNHLPSDDDAWPMEARAPRIAEQIARALRLCSVPPLAAITGLVQGMAAARGWIDVEAERVRTRPIFHAAAQAAGRGTPATIAAMDTAAQGTVGATAPSQSPHKVRALDPTANAGAPPRGPMPAQAGGATAQPARPRPPKDALEAPTFPFQVVDRVARVWATSPAEVMAWIGLDVEEATLLATPARAEAEARLDGALRLGEAQRALGWSLGWRGFLATPVPGHGGRTWSEVIEAQGPKAAVDAARAIAAGVHA